jgi:3-methyladenine DNA glycosylase/8-oxoguanine DNA glycosylase
MTGAPAALDIELSPFSLARSFALQRLSTGDPTAVMAGRTFSKCWLGQHGALRCDVQENATGFCAVFSGQPADVELAAKAWSGRLDETAPAFLPTAPALRRKHAAGLGLRLLPMPWLYDVVCGAIIQQRVRFIEACRSWRRLALGYGEAGINGLHCFPSAKRLSELSPALLRPFDLDAQRASTLLRFAKEACFKPLPLRDFGLLRKRLERVPGIGPWTVSMALGFGAGDPDAVPTGDVHLPHAVCQLLAGEREGTDERMVELLKPYQGHRFRVIRLASSG